MKNRVLINIEARKLNDCLNELLVQKADIQESLQTALKQGIVKFSFQHDGQTVEAIGTTNPDIMAMFKHVPDILGFAALRGSRIEEDLNVIDEDQAIIDEVQRMYKSASEALITHSHETIEYYDIVQQKEVVFNKNLIISVYV